MPELYCPVTPAQSFRNVNSAVLDPAPLQCRDPSEVNTRFEAQCIVSCMPCKRGSSVKCAEALAHIQYSFKVCMAQRASSLLGP